MRRVLDWFSPKHPDYHKLGIYGDQRLDWMSYHECIAFWKIIIVVLLSAATVIGVLHWSTQ